MKEKELLKWIARLVRIAVRILEIVRDIFEYFD